MEIYKGIDDGRKDSFVINAMLKLCLHFDEPDYIQHFWNDIPTLFNISYPLLIKGCSLASNIKIDQCIEALSLMKSNDYRLKIHDKFISRLIDKCSESNIESLHALCKFINDGDIKTDNSIIIGTKLINAFSNFNDIKSAMNVFDCIPFEKRDNVILTSMMSAFIKNGRFGQALRLYDDHSSINDNVTHLLAIRACRHVKNYEKGREIDKKLNKKYGSSLAIALIELYGSCNDVDAAQTVFDQQMGWENMVIGTVNAMMNVLNANGQHKEALHLYESMDLCMNSSTHCHAINACQKLGYFERGKMIHQKIKDFNPFIQQTLIEFYGHFGHVADAQKAFNKTKTNDRNVCSMMKVYVDNQMNNAALKLYDDAALHKGDKHCLMIAIKAITNNKDLKRAKNIHASIRGYSDDVILQNAVINMFTECGDFECAKSVFDGIEDKNRDIVSISNMMKAFIYNKQDEDALDLYDRYGHIQRDKICHLYAIKACHNTNNVEKAKDIESSTRFIEDIDFKNALIDLYGSCNTMTNAINTFDSIQNDRKNTQTFNCMMNGYCKNDMSEECIHLFKADLFVPDIETYKIMINTCTNTTAFYFGQQIHERMTDPKIFRDCDVQICLINMYGKCGKLHLCDDIFADIQRNEIEKYKTNLSIWNAMIHSYARNGEVLRAMDLYQALKEMQTMNANHKTFTFLMNACAHSGDTGQALKIWNHEIGENVDKYDIYLVSALVDCLSRSGHLKDAYNLIHEYEDRKMEENIQNDVMYNSLMFGCRKYKNQSMAKQISEEYKQRFGDSLKGITSNTVALSNIIGTDNEYDKVNKMRDEMKLKGIAKVPGISSIEIFGDIHKFYAGDVSKEGVESKLEEIANELRDHYGYVPDLSCITRQLNENETAESVLLRHGEKLALMYGLLNTPRGCDLFINKNLRICNDCHNFIKLFTKMEKRKVIVGDANRVHTFYDGLCSCNDFY